MSRELPRFSVGDSVTWRSQSASVYSTKTGTVVAVVPPCKDVLDYARITNPGAPRDHESYVVKVDGKRKYWPRVSLLSLTKDAP